MAGIKELLKGLGLNFLDFADGDVITKQGYEIASESVKLKDITIRVKEQAASTTLDFSDSLGKVSQIIFTSPLSSDLEITSISNVNVGDTVELIVAHNNRNITFSPSIAGYQQSFTDQGGEYIIKIKKVRSYITGSAVETFKIYDSVGGGSGTVTDTIPPALTSISVPSVSITQASAQLQVTSDKDGKIYWGVFVSGSTPTKVDIINGSGAVDFDVHNTIGGVESIVASGLDGDTAYIFAFFSENNGGYSSNVYPFENFSTLAVADTDPPNYSINRVINIANETATYEGNIDEPGTLYVWIGADGNSPTDEAALKAGTGAVFSDSLATNGGTTEQIAITGLTQNTPYDVYAMAEDDEGTPNETAIQTKIDITTTNVTSAAVTTWHTNGPQTNQSIYSNYLKWLPPNHVDTVPKPFWIFLHGYDTSITEAELRSKSLMNVVINNLRVAFNQPDAVVVALAKEGSQTWKATEPTAWVNDMIDWALASKDNLGATIDAGKVSLFGQSDGASGVHNFIAVPTRAAKIACVVAMSTGYQRTDFIANADTMAQCKVFNIHGALDSGATPPQLSEHGQYYIGQASSQPLGPPEMHMFTDYAHSSVMWEGVLSGALYGDTQRDGIAQPVVSSPFADSGDDLLERVLAVSRAASDTAAPILSGVTVDNISSTTARFRAQSNEAAFIYWVVVPQGSGLLGQTDIQDGTGVGILDYGTIDTAGGILESDNISGLTASTDYEVQYWADDKVTPISNKGVVTNTNGDFSTTAIDNTAPVFSGVSVDTIGENTANFNFTVNDSSLNITVYWVATLASAGNLTAVQIIAATDGSIVASGSYEETTGGVARTESVTGLSAGTNHKIQYTAVDSASTPNTTTEAQEAFTTTSAGAIARALGNFGGTTVPSLGGNWNESRSDLNEVAIKEIMSSMIDFDSGSSLGWTMWVTLDRFSTASDNGVGYDPGDPGTPGAPTELCDAVRGYWWRPAGEITRTEFRNLTAGKSYQVRFFASRDRTQVTRTTVQMNPDATGPSSTVDAGSGGNDIDTIGYTDGSNPNWFIFTADGSGISPEFEWTTPDAYFYMNSFELQQLD